MCFAHELIWIHMFAGLERVNVAYDIVHLKLSVRILEAFMNDVPLHVVLFIDRWMKPCLETYTYQGAMIR